MTRTAEALVTPELLVWARETARIPDHVAAQKLEVGFTLFKMWEDGGERPTFAQLKKIAWLYRRSVAVFFLPQPPSEPPPPTDYRRSEISGMTESSDLAFAIRSAHSRRDVALDLAVALGEEPLHFRLEAKRSDGASSVSLALRGALGVSVDEQFAWANAYAAFRGWRAAVERLGVLVFQFRGVEVSEARGFSIDLRPYPVAAINISDAIRARSFSLLHEMTHLLLGDGGLCDFHEGSASDDEHFCNVVAAETLVPREPLRSALAAMSRPAATSWRLDDIGYLSRRFWVSDEAMLLRLRELGEIEEGHGWGLWRALRDRRGEAKKPGFPRRVDVALAVAGPAFANLVFDGVHRDIVSLSDASDYLDLRVKHFPALEDALVSTRATAEGDE